jgi:hypothetical protein
MALTKVPFSMLTGAPNNVKDFGAIGDNVYRPLSTVTEFRGQDTTGWSLAQWQTVFPHVVSLDQTLDWAAIQAAIDYASRGAFTRESVYIPDGYYVITTSLQLPNFVTLVGQSTNGTIINNQNIPMTDVGQIVNKDPGSWIYVTLKNLTLRGGTTGININVTGETANCVFENVGMDLHTDFNVNVNKLLQTSKWINCTFADATYGILVGAFTANLNTFVNCEFNNHAWSSVYFRSSEVNNFIGCRFEGGGIQGRATVDVTDTRNLNFIGCYFEATHEIAITESGSCNSIWVDGCHFTGATRVGQVGLFPYQFVSDGIIQFGNNNWGAVNSNGPSKLFSSGMNATGRFDSAGVALPQLGNTGLNTLYTAYSKQRKNITSKWGPVPVSLRRDLLRFRKPNIDGSVSNLKALTGKLTLQCFGLNVSGFEYRFIREYLVFVRCSGFSVMGASITLGTNDTSASGATLTVQQKTGATSEELIVEAVFTGLTPSTDIGSVLQWSFEYMHGSVNEGDYIDCDVV